MKKILSLITVLCLLISAASAEIDLSSMTTEELTALQESISQELSGREKSKPYIKLPEDEKERRKALYQYFEDKGFAYEFSELLTYIDSDECELPDNHKEEIRTLISHGAEMVGNLIIDVDMFTNEKTIYSPLAQSIGDKTRFVPYMKDHDMCAIVGFPYDDAFYFDKILVKMKNEKDIQEYSRNDFDIEFEIIGKESWEYCHLQKLYTDTNTPVEAIGFREDGSTRKVDYILTETDRKAFMDVLSLDDIAYAVCEIFRNWTYHEE